MEKLLPKAAQDFHNYTVRKEMAEEESGENNQVGYIQYYGCSPYPILENQKVILQEQKTNTSSKDDFFYFDKEKRFVKLWDSAIAALVNTRLSKGEWIIVLYLAQYVDYRSCVAKDGDRIITRNDIVLDCNLSPETVKKNMKHLRKLGILTEVKIEERTKIFVNPFVYCRGHKANATLLEMFKDTPQYREMFCKASKSDLKICNGFIELKDTVTFTKMWTDNFSDVISPKLTGGEFAILILCMSYVKRSDGVLFHKNGKPLTFENMVDMTNLSTWTVEKAINKFVNISFLAKAEYTRLSTGEIIQCYAINPILCAKGEKVNRKVHDLFNKE